MVTATMAPAPVEKAKRLTDVLHRRQKNYAKWLWRFQQRDVARFRNLRWHGNPRLAFNPNGLRFDLAPFVYGHAVVDPETESILWNPQPLAPAIIFPQQDGRMLAAGEPFSSHPMRLYWCDADPERIRALRLFIPPTEPYTVVPMPASYFPVADDDDGDDWFVTEDVMPRVNLPKKSMVLPRPRVRRRRAKVTEWGYHTSKERTKWNQLERRWAIARERPGLENPAQIAALHGWYRMLQCRAIENKALLSSLSTLRPKAIREYVDRRD